MKLVLFDIDGTLVTQPGTELRFFRHLLRAGLLGPRQLGVAALYTLALFPRFGRDTLRKNKSYLSGLQVSVVAEQAEQFVANTLAQHLIPATVKRLREHVNAGDRVVLLSGTPQFIADPLARYLGAEYAMGALCARRGDRFVGGLPCRHPFNGSKVDAARQIAERFGLPLGEAVAYGDSVNDTALFRKVKHSVAIRPGQRLYTMARHEGWEVITG